MELVVHSTHRWDLPSSSIHSNSSTGATYEHLDATQKAFRLLILRPGKRTDLVVCDLEVSYIDASQCHQYEALSYVWGDPPGSDTILLRGQNFPVTSNLKDALRCLRFEDHQRTLWVDALCINQENLQERNHQVRMMRSIYQSASQVIVWLGHSENAKSVIDAILRFADDETLHWVLPDPKGLKHENEPTNQLVLFFWFFNIPWWRRIWTVQEAAVATNLVYTYGDISIPPDTFKKIARNCLSHIGKCCDPSAGHLSVMDLKPRMKKILELEDLRDKNYKADFLKVFQMVRYREATNPRDMIYGLIGLTTGLDEGIIRYEATIQETYQQSTLEIISKNGNLDVFSHNLGYPKWTKKARHIVDESVGDSRYSVAQLPSWVPDWNRRYKHTYLSSVTVRQKRLKLFGAGKDRRASVNLVAPGKLAIEGLDLLRVKQISSEKPNTMGGRQIWLSWRRMACIDSNPDRPYVAGGTILNAYWRTLCHDSSLENTTYPLRRAITDDRFVHDEWWWRWMIILNDRLRLEKRATPSQFQCWREFEDAVQDLCTGRSFFISSSGYIGLVPSTTVVGDRICVLSGGKLPFVLRPHRKQPQDDDSHSLEYTFIGDAYVHGLMDGEAMDMVEKGVLELQNLILR